jgi:hypothetical protein
VAGGFVEPSVTDEHDEQLQEPLQSSDILFLVEPTDLPTIGETARRASAATSTLRFYKDEGLASGVSPK